MRINRLTGQETFRFRRRESGLSTAYLGSANMSHAAMTSGLEWNLKVTAQDLSHVLEKFTAEFETFWHSREFLPYDPADPVPFRQAIVQARKPDHTVPAVFFDLQPHPFQERILEALALERTRRCQLPPLVRSLCPPDPAGPDRHPGTADGV